MAIQIRRTTTGGAPTGLQPGQLAVEMGPNPPILWVGVPTAVDPSGRKRVNPEAAGLGTALSTTSTGTFNLNNVRQAGLYYATNWSFNAIDLNLPPDFWPRNMSWQVWAPFTLLVEGDGVNFGQQTITALATLGSWSNFSVAPGNIYSRRLAHGYWTPWEQQITTIEPPALEIQMMYNWPSYGYGGGNGYFQLYMANGTILPDDKVFLLRESFSGYGTRRRDDSYDHYNYGWVQRYTYLSQGKRQGFRHPPHQPVNQAMTRGRLPNWGNQRATEWTPQFHPRGWPSNVPVAGSRMFMWIDWGEVMRYKPLHRRRGTERFKFVIARPNDKIGYGQSYRLYQFGDCLNTLVVRLHHHRPVGATNRIISVTVRP